MKQKILIHSSFLILALWTIHLWFFTGEIPVESGDEPVHTFVEIPIFFRALWEGHFLQINLFNAFGTPLVGDPVFVPWAPHTLIYAFAPGWMGLMLSKVLVLFCTLEALYYLGRKWGLTDLLAAWSSIITGINPAFLYFLNHHPHQGAILYFVLFLFCFENLITNFSRRNLLILAVSYLFLIIGVGINGIAISHLFLILYFILTCKRLDARAWTLTLTALGGTLLIYLPHFISFLKWAPLTVRSEHRIFDLPNVGHFDWKTLIHGMFNFLDQVRMHIDLSVVQTVLLPTMVGLIFILWNSKIENKKIPFGIRDLFILGALPTLIVYILLVKIDWLLHVPFFKSTDITRVLWYSLIFTHLAFAIILQSTIQKADGRHSPRYVAFFMIMLLICAGVFANNYQAVIHQQSHRIAINFWLALTSIISLLALVWIYTRTRPTVLWIPLLLMLLPKLIVFHHVSESTRSRPDQFGVIPPQLDQVLPPFTRMASLYPFGESPDQRLAVHSIFGSGGRSIILSKELKLVLNGNQLINEDTNSYSMRAEAIEGFDQLGIRYLVTRNSAVQSLRWRPIQDLAWRGVPYRVYERTIPVTPVYCATSPQHFFKAEFVANQIRFVADQDCPMTVATFFHWPGWQLKINGQSMEMAEPKVAFITAGQINKNDVVEFEFSPWWVRRWWVFGLAGLTVICMTVIRAKGMDLTSPKRT